ncbi:MAG TPA: hypothetical protein VGE01_14940 [Fimbriimonas sp.]
MLLRTLPALVTVAVMALLPAPSLGDEKDHKIQRDELERLKNETAAVEAATSRTTAWFETRHLPAWKDRQGTAPLWTEIGPSVIKESWGGMENAGRATALVVDPRNPRMLTVGAASGGIWRSEDEGASWTPIADQVASLSIGDVALDPFDPEVVYAGTGEPHYSIDSFHGAGFLRSRNGGKTWDLLASDVFLGYRFCRIVPNPKRPGFIYAATTRGVYRSLDHGGTWVKLLDGSASDIVIDPKNPNVAIAGIGFAWGAANNGLYLSTNSGASWKRLLPEVDGRKLGRIQIAQCASYPNVVYASLYGVSGGLQGLYKTTDLGTSWVRMPNAPNYAGDSAWYYDCIAVSPKNPNHVFVGGFSTFRSLDGGETWEDNTKSYDGGPVHPDHHALTFSPFDAQTVYLCTDGGVFRTRNLGSSWESISNGLGTVQFQSVDVHPWDENKAWGGTQDNGTNVYEGSTAWRNTFLGDGGVTRVNWKDPNVVYTEYVNLTICKSTDGGKSWEWNTTNGIDPAEGKLFYAPFTLDPSDPDTLVAGAQKVYRSTDAARNWTAISPILGSRVSAVTVAPNNSKVIYAGTSDGKLWVTADTGATWHPINAGLPRSYVSDVCVDPRNARVVYVALSGWNPQRLWKSTDAGGTWKCIDEDLPPMPMQALCLNPRRPDTLYAATFIGVFMSPNGGGRWYRLGSNLPNVPVFSIVANVQTNWITIGTHGRGAWRIPLE